MTHRVILHSRRFEPYISGPEIDARVRLMAREITRDLGGPGSVPLIAVTLGGGFVFAGELARNLGFVCEFAFVKCSSYNSGMESSGDIKFDVGLTAPPDGRDILVLEDIVETGNTYRALHRHLECRGARSVRIATLLLKEDKYDGRLPLDYVGFRIEDKFVVGYGMDYNGLGRNLDGVYKLSE